MIGGTRRLVPLTEVRKGIGAVMIGSALFHFGITLWLCLAQLRFTTRLPSTDWPWLYLWHFVYTWSVCVFFMTRKMLEGHVFVYQAIIDALAGYVVFWVAFRAAALALAKGFLPLSWSWLGLAPSLFLLAYGIVLARGRQIWSALDI